MLAGREQNDRTLPRDDAALAAPLPNVAPTRGPPVDSRAPRRDSAEQPGLSGNGHVPVVAASGDAICAVPARLRRPPPCASPNYAVGTPWRTVGFCIRAGT